MGRKAGLKTSEMYPALASGRPLSLGADARIGDGNGFAAGFDADGNQVYYASKSQRPS
jgi:hypothetical protein